MTVHLLDSTILSNFAWIQRPDLLRLAFPDLATTKTVMSEICQGVREKHLPKCDWSWLSILGLTSAEKALQSEILKGLDPGESSCLAVAIMRGLRFLSDDMDARRFARERQVPVSGTLGALSNLVVDQHITAGEADFYLAEMIKHGYRSPVRSLRELMRQETEE